jgi:HlyD family secretion protein
LLALTRQLWELLDDAQRRTCIFVVLTTVVAACLTLAGVAGVAPFFAVLSDPAFVDRNSTLAWLRDALAIETSEAMLASLGVGFVVLLFVANFTNFIALLAIGRFSQSVGARMHSLLFDEYLSRDLDFHAGSNSAVLATRVVHDVTRTVGGIVQSGLTLCASAASIALITAAVVFVDPLVAAVAVALFGASYVLIYALVRDRLRRNGKIVTEHWKARAKVIVESFAAIKDVIVHRAQPSLAARVAHHSTAIAAAHASAPAIAAAPKYVLECLTGAGLVTAALWVYGRVGADQWMTHLAFLGLAAYRLLPAIQQAFTAIARINAERAAFDGIAGDLRSARRRASGPRPPAARGDAWRGRPRTAIRLVDVSYRHSTRRPGGISGVSLEIPAGTLAAFVGPNGSGKTTLAELLLGLRVPHAGRIEVDGIELGAANRDAWLDTVAYVPQQIALLDGTLAQNIAFCVEAREVDHQRVREAARSAQLEPVLAALPSGFATVIGENGAQLSGGQRQRVGLARALYRRASLLIVDEGTNALDALSETEIMTLLRAMCGECTIIVIGHRPSALAACDLTFELDGGRLMRTSERAGAQPRELARR